jgi:UDP-2-acetamido-3-amino-2,3-dideoxy-glucuronate N-acetyltransferase
MKAYVGSIHPKAKIAKTAKIHCFVYIEADVSVGENCNIKPFVFIPDGVIIKDNVFIGPGVTFTNDKYPRIATEWDLENTVVEEGASIGAGSVICPGVVIGEGAMVGAGSVVTKSVQAHTVVAGNPAREIPR